MPARLDLLARLFLGQEGEGGSWIDLGCKDTALFLSFYLCSAFYLWTRNTAFLFMAMI